MDIEEVIQSNLQALRKLYGLLKSDGYSLQTKNLDHKARLLLRNLLDAAAERIFKAHAEILAARCGSSDKASSTIKEQSKEMLKLEPPPFHTNFSNNFTIVKDLNTQKDVLEKGEWESQQVSSEQSGLKIFSSQPQVSTKRCRVCKRSRKQLKSSDEPKIMDWEFSNPGPTFGGPFQAHEPFQFVQGNLMDKGLMPPNISPLQTANFTESSQGQNGKFEFQSYRADIENSTCSTDKPEEVDQISKEASFKIELIESRMADLRLTAKPPNAFQSQIGTQSELHESRNELSQAVDFFRDTIPKVWEPTQWHQIPNQCRGAKMSNQTVNVPGKNVRAIIDRIESVSEVRSWDDHMETQTSKLGQDFTRVPADMNKTVKADIFMPAKLPSHLEKENLDQYRTVGNVGKSQPSTPSVRSKFSRLQVVDAGRDLSKIRTRAESQIPHQKITRKNLLDRKSTQHSLSPIQWEKDRAKKNHQIRSQRLISQSTGSRYRYSSSLTSQQASSSFSDDEGYSESSHIRTHNFSGSSTSIETPVYSRHGRNVGPKVRRSSSDSNMYSVSSRTRGSYPLDSDSSGESQDYLSYTDESVDSTSRRMDKKQKTGRLKKLKDKLALIFHHHHHHHHESGRHVVVKGGKALWKHAGKVLDRNKDGYGEDAVKKIGKDKNHQHGHFHALVDGLLQHIRHSKKSKPTKGGGGRHGSGGGKKVAAKLHWWQMLRRQRGLKVPKKPRGEYRVGRKNPKLKALPEPKGDES